MRRWRTDRLGDAGKAVGAKQFGKTFLYVGHETRARKNKSRIELHETSARANLLVRFRGAPTPPTPISGNLPRVNRYMSARRAVEGAKSGRPLSPPGSIA